MPNVLVVPVSGAIFFDRNVAGASTVAALNSAVRLSYDQGGGLNITSYTTASTALDRFTVDGAQGRLFSVADSLTGSLMSVNDIAGLPILEVLDTDTVIAGSYNTNAFIVSGTRIGISTRPFDTSKLGVSGNVSVIGSISSNAVIYASGGNSNQWNSNYTTTNSNSAAWSNWGSVSSNYALGSQYVKLSGDNMTGLLTNSVGISSFSLSARFIDLVHIPANDGTNPVLRIGEYDTASGNQGFSGMYMSYDERTNAFGISAQFSPNAGVPAINIDRNANTSIRSLYAGPLDFAYTGSFTSLSSISGMFVDPVRGNAGFATFDPIAPLDVRGTMVRVASARTMSAPSNLKVQSNYAYVLNYTSGSLQVFDVSYTSALSTVSAGAGTNPYGLYVNGEHAYVVTSNGSSSQLLIFKLAAGTPIMISATTIGWGTFNATDVYVQGNYAYILGSNSSTSAAGRFTVWNISNPANPRMIINYSSAGFNPRGLLVQDRYAYYTTSSFGSLNLYRVDVSDVATGNLPAPISVYSTTGNFYSFTVRGNYAYMEISASIVILDLTRLNVVSTISVTLIPLSWTGEMVLQGNYLYVMRYSLLFKIDISNPVAPFIVQILAANTANGSYTMPLQIQGRYAYILDHSTGFNSIRVIDLGGAYIQQLQTGGIKTDKLYVAQNSILGNDLDVSGGAAFGQGFKSYKDSSIQGALTLTTLSGASAVNYFSVLTGFNSTLFIIASTGNVGVGTGSPNEKLTVVGTISTNAHKTSQDWASNWTTTNTNSASWSNTYILTSTDFIITQPSNWVVSTASNGVTATLPASPATGTTINFLDANKTWATNNLVLLRNGQTIESLAENLNCDISGFSFSLTYIGGSIGWRVY